LLNRKRPRWATIFAAAILLTLFAGVGFFWFRAHERRTQADLLAERGFSILRRGTPGFGSQAAAQFREALTLVPNHPAATAGTAESAARLSNGSFDHALELARRAVAADPSCSECQSVLGYILGVRMWRWQEAGNHLKRAVELNPSRATHRIYLTEWLMVQGRLGEASANAELATRLDPSNSRSWTILAAVRYFQRRNADSIREAEHSSSLDPQHPSALLWSYHSAMRLADDENAALTLRGRTANTPRSFTPS